MTEFVSNSGKSVDVWPDVQEQGLRIKPGPYLTETPVYAREDCWCTRDDFDANPYCQWATDETRPDECKEVFMFIGVIDE